MVYRDAQPGAVFYHESGHSFRVQDKVAARFNYDWIEVGFLGEGSKATVCLYVKYTDSTIYQDHQERSINVIYLCKRDTYESRALFCFHSTKQASLSSNQTCSICGLHPAISFCKCKKTPVLLCNTCLPEHQAKDPFMPHAIMPIAAAQDPEEYIRKFNAVRKNTDALRQNVQLIEQFEQEFSASVDIVINSIVLYRDSWLERLRTERDKLAATIEPAIQEAESCLAQRTQPTTLLAYDLCDEFNEFKLIHYSVTQPNLRELFKTWVTYYNIFRAQMESSVPIVFYSDHKPRNAFFEETLNCGDRFNEEELSKRAEIHMAAVIKTPISCCICDTPIGGYALQKVMKPESFLEYKTKLREAQAKLTYCPNCRTAYTQNAEMLQLPTFVGCKYCGVQFCSRCQRLWDMNHNMKICKFEDRQRQVAELQQGMGPDDMIAQCPICKIPYRMNCQRKTMVCKICNDWNEWCFQCCALSNPIQHHGNHWHRPNCKYWTPKDINRQPSICTIVCSLHRPCDPPPQLKVSQRFDFDEY